jgi:hypothetical protein
VLSSVSRVLPELGDQESAAQTWYSCREYEEIILSTKNLPLDVIHHACFGPRSLFSMETDL